MLEYLSSFDMTPRPTGFKDREGTEIKVGDVVEFFAGAPSLFSGAVMYAASPGPFKLTRMRDVVIEDSGRVYFMCKFGGCLARRAAHVCKVIGTDLSLVDT